jgi:hypothetical protein
MNITQIASMIIVVTVSIMFMAVMAGILLIGTTFL